MFLFSVQSKQKSRSHSFECMNKEKRQVVHDLAGHFGCTAEAYDAEPKRNVVATAGMLKQLLVVEVFYRKTRGI